MTDACQDVPNGSGIEGCQRFGRAPYRYEYPVGHTAGLMFATTQWRIIPGRLCGCHEECDCGVGRDVQQRGGCALVLKAGKEGEIGQPDLVVSVETSIATSLQESNQRRDAVCRITDTRHNSGRQPPVAAPMPSPKPLLGLKRDMQTPDVF